ncbi:MAG: S49 family peptidase [Gemmatimonadaceae bacterium]|nr:S49 family peptidase [Gemmatimonadaceae bacterium]
MSRRPALRALQLLTSTRWAITREALERMMAIAERDTDQIVAAIDRQATAPRAGEDDGEGIDLSALVPARRWALLATPAAAHPLSERLGVRDGVAIVSAVGPLCRYASFFQELCGMSSYQLLAEDFRIAVDDPGVRAILVHLDSPGGETNGCAELAALIHAHRGTKPIVAMVSDGAASAAYWIAAACDEIVVTPSAYVGSIGVYFEIVDWSAAEAEYGMKRWRIVSTQSPNKVPDPADAAGKAVLQREVDEFADAFLAAVATYRGTTAEELIAAGDGGAVFIGRHAVARGLADRMGTTEDILAELATRAATPSTTTAAAAAAAPKETVMPPTPPKAAGTARATDENKDDEEARKRAEEEEKEKQQRAEGEQPDEDEDDAEASEEEDDEMAEEDDEEQARKAERAFVTANATMVARIRRRARRGARKAERERVKAVIALAPKAIAPALRTALESGQAEGEAAKAFLAASQQTGAQALAAMAGAEATITAPTQGDGTPTAEKDGAPTIALLQEHSPTQRRGAAAARRN